MDSTTEYGEFMHHWELRKTFTFEASHQLMHHDGKCSRLHGHSWKGTVILRSAKLIEEGPQQNMVVDFGYIQQAIHHIVAEYLDHHHLNDTLQTDSPTSEVVARWIYEHLIKLAPAAIVDTLWAVTIEETCTSSCTYSLADLRRD